MLETPESKFQKSDRKALKTFLTNLEKLKEELHTLDRDSLADLICQSCEFYSPEKERLECGAFKILSNLISKRILTREMLEKLKEKT